jgi:hypothetical protein
MSISCTSYQCQQKTKAKRRFTPPPLFPRASSFSRVNTLYVDVSALSAAELSRKPPDHSVDCVGVLAIRGGYIVGVAILALRSEVFTDLNVVTSIAMNLFSDQPLEYWCRDHPLGKITYRC